MDIALSEKGLVMPPSNPVDHERSTCRTSVLLAPDKKNSVVSEILVNGTNYVAFSPYGEMSPLPEVMTHLGFNGELREQRTGWYFLGNGYRAYNPRLMRFHSPDTFSPFGKGGMHAYMYCGGEPVMRADPSGESWFSKWLFERFADVMQIVSPAGNGGGVRRMSSAAEPAKSGDLLHIMADLAEKQTALLKRTPSTPGRSRPPQPIDRAFSTTARSGTSAIPERNSSRSKYVLEGNYGVRPQNTYSRVKTKGGVSMSGTDSGTRQFPSGSRSIRFS